ncbi:DUF4054 domain-containing protein [Mannheimia bovis]|uniref:DUF4054 domain-containing protein n=1 Tax=Mannheimia bovis TaxID=2770636 RepID=A0A7H1C0R2_9PAST|nr:DUF4054 domain-containing protein [Mannheimia bovis]QNS14567.1 DUF4054 domain-containing protein [Mannheimia bovis]
MSVLGFLQVIAPNYVRDVEPERIKQLLTLAEHYRPECLPNDKQDLAVAYYVAYLVAQGNEAKANPYGVTSEREGDISRTYSANLANSSRFLAKWQELNDICVRVNGSITVGFNYGGC